MPSGPVECYEKVDGSLIIIFHDGRRWRAATKGSFVSSQAAWAQDVLDNLGIVEEAALDVGDTYLAEAVYPENRIVVAYRARGLALLGGYDAYGYEMDRQHVEHIGDRVGWRCARSVTYASLAELVATTRALARNAGASATSTMTR